MEAIRFEFVADTVMGGRSSGALTREMVARRQAWRLTGTVSLENNGGFIQMAADLSDEGRAVDASDRTGIAFQAIDSSIARGLWPNRGKNGETYNIHLRTTDLTRPWQSYRQSFIAGPEWETHRIPFTDFTPHSTSIPLNTSRLRRIGIVAIGRAFEADVSIANVGFY
ncbi:MAG: CIA30 family protein [Pseudomonadota bacterium]